MMRRIVCTLFILLLGLLGFSRGKELTLDILHINDIHSHFEETSHQSSRCKDPSQLCVGGVARLYAKQKEIREINPDTTIFLNAGDFYQGTVWYTEFKYAPVLEFGNKLNYTAMGLGNHDFEDQVAGLIPFAEQANFDLLASNIVTNSENFIEGIHFKRSIVKEINGTQVGIIGYITQMTESNFPQGEIQFTDEIESVRLEAEKLNAEGVKVIIALGHSGYQIDQELARNIPLLDIVVGGHTHTFLYTPLGEDDIPEDTIQGPYPTYVTSSSGKVIPVVQAKCFTKYLGHIIVNFDSQGELIQPVEGAGVSFAQPYLLDDNQAKPDQQILQMLQKYQANLTEYKKVYGYTEVNLVEAVIDNEETLLGNVLADSMADYYEDATIALINNGGIRAELGHGNITGEDIFMVIPYGNTIDRLRLKGREVKKALEVRASNLETNHPEKYPGFGLQVSGLKLVIRPEADNIGDRIISIKTFNKDTGTFEDMKMDTIYTLAVTSYIVPKVYHKYIKNIFDDVIIEEHIPGNVGDIEVFEEWLIKNTPIHPQIEDRIIFQF